MRAASSIEKFRLVMWKNWILMIRNKKSEFMTFLLPIACFSLFVVLRYVMRNGYSESPDISYAPLGLDKPDKDDFTLRELSYFPKNYSIEMDHVKSRLGLDKAIGFDSIQAWEDYFKNNSKILGIRLRLDQQSKKLHITVKSMGFGHMEDLRVSGYDIKEETLANGGSDYYKLGFAYVQQVIFETLVGSPNNVTIQLNRYPVQSFTRDPLMVILAQMGILFIPMIFMNVFTANLKHIVEEKESQLKEMLLIMGLPNWVDWLAWFSKVMLETIPISIIVVFLLKYPFIHPACLPMTNCLLLWLVLALMLVNVATFTMLVSTFVNNSKRTNLVGTVAFSACMIPILFSTAKLTSNMATLGLVLWPSAAAFAFRSIVLFEQLGVGMQWRYFLTPVPGNDAAFPIAYYLIGMLVMNVVHILIMLYVEGLYPGEFGTPRPWYFPVEGLFRGRGEYIELSGSSSHAPRAHPKCEQPASDGVPGIVITQLTKQYKSFKAVNQLTLTINENEIMVLLGENGAGKSTTMAMLTGVIRPSGGTALIYQQDIRTEMRSIRNQIGLCPQKNVLFDQLTVLEHLLLFGQIKGLSFEEAKSEAGEFMARLTLAGKMNEESHTLSGGMKRKLNLAIALAGQTKAVFLDEPTSGVDPESRREIWRMLQDEKQHRMILLSTHFMDEADVLGDRVAILHQGELKCSGSAFFLKNKFHSAYKLTCAIRDGFRIEPLLNLIQKYVPDAILRDNYGMEYHFELNPKYLSAFGELFKRLESSEASLGISSFGIELPTLEEVFLKVIRDEDQPDSAQYRALEMGRHIHYHKVEGCGLRWNWFKAIAKKRHYYNLRNAFMFLVQILLPTLYIGVNLIAGTEIPSDAKVRRIDLSLDAYGHDLLTIVEAKEASGQLSTMTAYKELLKPYGGLTETNNLTGYILNLDMAHYDDFKQKAVVGAKFSGNDTILAMFNNQAFHAIPIALTMIYNAVIKGNQLDHPQLEFSYEKYWNMDFHLDFTAKSTSLFSLQIILTFIMLPSMMGSFNVIDRASGALNILFISGMSPIFYWICTLLLDLIPFNLCILGGIGTCIAGDLIKMDVLLQLYLILLLYGMSILSFIYLRARRFKLFSDYSDNMLVTGVVSLIPYFVMKLAMTTGTALKIRKVLTYIYLGIPFFNLLDSIVKLVSDEDESLLVNYLYFGGSAALFMLILILNDLHLLSWLYVLLENTNRDAIGTLEEDVQAEMDAVDAMTPRQIEGHLLVAKHLSKSYDKARVVKDVTLFLNRGECLGLLGKNGAGKTTTFKMLTGEEVIASGDAWINGVSIKSSLVDTYQSFGYCPQVDSILDELTGVQAMEVIGLARGIPSDQILDISESLAFELGFVKHMKKQASQMSGGNKRKLCTAIALIGSPSLLYLDEPTTGMDPSAKRSVWTVMGKFRQGGHSLILTTHSMEECEALCTKVTILKDGKMEAIGSGYHLKQKYAKVGHLVVQLERSKRRDSGRAADLKGFLNGQLRGLTLKEEYQGKMEFEFYASENLSKLFNLMESIKKKYAIESYAVSNQNSLENVFLEFVA